MHYRPYHRIKSLAYWLASFAAVSASLVMTRTSQASEGYSAVPLESSIEIHDGGKLVTTYQFRSGSKPIFWPIMGPDGKSFTRDYPMIPDTKGERHDHPHHRGLWMTFGEVNEFDLWGEGNGKGTVCQVGTPEVQVDESGVRIRANHVWKEGQKGVSSVSTEGQHGCDSSLKDLATCVAEYWVHGTADQRTIDCTYVLTASQDLHFGDSKEGFFAIRVPEPMKVDAGKGSILSSTGRTDGDTWGHPARWIDYSGPTLADDPATYGIAILVHPENFGSDGRWHVRTYGLFAHNPFGVKEFPKLDNPPASEKMGGHKLSSGDSYRFAYRVIFHRGAFDKEAGDKAWDEFSKQNPFVSR